MKHHFLIVALLAFASFLPQTAHAQWDYGQHAIDNIVENRIDIRKTRARMQKRRGSKTKAARTSSKRARGQRKVSAPVAKPSMPSSVEFYRDTYQDFHLDDSKGYLVNFVFTSTSGKVLRRSYRFSYYNGKTDFQDIPAGKYRVVAEAVYGGKKYPVHLASEDGETDNPLGGNFAPSILMEVKLGRDSYGSPRLLTFPETLHVRVIG